MEQASVQVEQEQEQGPSLGMKYRQFVLAHARGQSAPGWRTFEALSASALAEVIGPARSAQEALELATAFAAPARAWP